MIDRVKVLHLTQNRAGHFRHVLPSQAVGLVLKKLNPTQKSKQNKYKMI